MLDLDGKVVALEVEDLKWICYVRDFNSGELNNPERLVRKAFAGRPRGEGLFVRARLRDGDLVEGLAANDATLVASDGVFLTPPDLRSNTQRIWIPEVVAGGAGGAGGGGGGETAAHIGHRSASRGRGSKPEQEELF